MKALISSFSVSRLSAEDLRCYELRYGAVSLSRQERLLCLVIGAVENVPVRHPERALFLVRDPACGDIGNAAVLKQDARYGRIDLPGNDRRPRGAHLDGLRAGQVRDDVKVVDHEVEDDVHVGAPDGEGGAPLGLQVPG